MNKKVSVITLSIVIFLSAFAGHAYAVIIPSFPSCTNPQGTVRVNYDNGTHGVAGDNNTYSGKDTVYTLSENTLAQCLCPTSGNGIQTNWWKAAALTQDEINVLISEGWVLIPNGSAWGLDNAPYLAKNSNYSCASTNTGSSGGASDSKSILATSTQAILGLANTGNIVFVLFTVLGGLALIGSGIALSKKNKS